MKFGHTWLFINGFAQFSLVLTNITWWHCPILRREKFIFGKNKWKVKIGHSQKDNFYEIVAPDIRTQVHKVTTDYRYWKCLARYWAQSISWPFFHIMSNLNSQQKSWIKDTTKFQANLHVCVYGHHASFIFK